MEKSLDDDDNLEEDGQDLFINFPLEVQNAIEQVYFIYIEQHFIIKYVWIKISITLINPDFYFTQIY